MNQFCFIICANNDLFLEECQNYISRLFVPEGYTIDILTIKDAPSIASAYNAAMKESHADYKIYLHQDLFIVNRYFLFNILDIFNSNNQISMIGMVGTASQPQNAIMWNGKRHGALWSFGEGSFDERIHEVSYFDSVAVDGAIMVTSKDVPWREDIFDGFDFYDISECFEHRRKGYKIVVPSQHVSWCIHDDGYYLSLFNYNKYRRTLLNEYSLSEFALSGRIEDVQTVDPEKEEGYDRYLEYLENNKDELQELESSNLNLFDTFLEKGDIDKFIKNAVEIKKASESDSIIMTSTFQMLIDVASALIYETELTQNTFISDISNLKELKIKYTSLQFYLRRIEISPDESFARFSYDYIEANDISPYIIGEILSSITSRFSRPSLIFDSISQYFLESNNLSKYISFCAGKEKYAPS